MVFVFVTRRTKVDNEYWQNEMTNHDASFFWGNNLCEIERSGDIVIDMCAVFIYNNNRNQMGNLSIDQSSSC